MKLNSTMLALSLGLLACTAGAQTVDMGPDATSYRRFLLYPHLEKGFAAMGRGERGRALAEFERARTLAPANPAMAIHLAKAYRHFGESARAQAVLREQLSRNPGHAALNQLLDELRGETAVAMLQRTQPVEFISASGSASGASQPTADATPAAPAPAAHRRSASGPQAVQRPSGPVASKERRAGASPAGRQPLPADPAYAFADQAYKASAQGNHAAAVRAARQAVHLTPENQAYRLLLVYELAQAGQFEEADAVASQAPRAKAPSAAGDELAARHKLVRRRIAFDHFEKANQAAAAGRSEAAIDSARQGVAYAPDRLAQRLQLVSLQLSARQWPAAAQSASEAMRVLGARPALLVLHAHALQRGGDRDSARAALDAALADPALTVSERLQFGLIAADAALANGEAQKALDLLAPLAPAPNAALDTALDTALDAAPDAGVLQRRQLALQALRRPVSTHQGQDAQALAWATPKVVCVGNAFTPFCEVWQGEAAPDPGHALAEAAYKSFGARDHDAAALQAREALALSPDNWHYRALRVNALMAGGQLAQAEQEASDFLASSADDGEMLALRSQLRQRTGRAAPAALDAEAALRSASLSAASEIAMLQQLGRPVQARARFATALQEGELASQPAVQTAYLAVQAGDDAAALDAFGQADSANALPDPALQDAGYAAGRLGRNAAAVDYFKRAIDASESGRTPLAPQTLFNARRTVADRTRSSGVSGSLTYRGIATSGLSLTPGATTDDTLQGGLEAYWRPFGYGDGSLVELYGGLAATLYSKADLVSGAPSVQAVLGARVKPLADANLVLALERRLGVGSQAQTDWLARVGYSWDKGLDLRVDMPAWWAAQVYAEAGRFIKLKQNYATFEGRAGRSFRLDAVHPRLVVFPHLVLGADHNTAYMAGKENAVGAGVGVSARYWFNESKYSAPRSYADVSLQYRARISGDERAKGVFLRFTLAY